MERYLGRWLPLTVMIIAIMMLLVSCSDVLQMKQQELSKIFNSKEVAKSLTHNDPTVESECTAVYRRGLSI